MGDCVTWFLFVVCLFCLCEWYVWRVAVQKRIELLERCKEEEEA